MLVSAAIEPYRKSYGKADSSSAMLEGRSASERMTASPRKICVPGVHACATAGARTSASRIASATRPAETARGDARTMSGGLDPDSLALTADRFAEIVQLVFDDVIDRVACG